MNQKTNSFRRGVSIVCLCFAALLLPVKVSADPLDEVARRTFHISTLGNFDLGFAAADSAQFYRARKIGRAHV